MKIKIEKMILEEIEIEVKTCPFCGGEPNIDYDHGQHGYYNPTARVECKCCNASIERDVSGKSEEEAYRFISELWNRRASDD